MFSKNEINPQGAKTEMNLIRDLLSSGVKIFDSKTLSIKNKTLGFTLGTYPWKLRTINIFLLKTFEIELKIAKKM